MNMNKGISIGLLVVGVLLLVFGLNAWHSVGSQVSETVTGAPTNKAIWLLVAGALLSIIGLFGTLRKGGPSV